MGKPKREVYDFLMSIDYGICHGPVDSINQVWIKDKRVLCGSYTEREDVDVDLPKLFGGDNGEGGVVGTAELYMGADDQTSSDALASRFNRTPTTMPGYRGLAHIFFRGKGTKRRGWRWSSNNPYLPTTRVSISRFPATLSETHKIIPATIGIDSGGNLVSFTGIDDEGPGASFTAPWSVPIFRDDDLSGLPGADTAVVSLGELGLEPTDLALAAQEGNPFKAWLTIDLQLSGSSGSEAVVLFRATAPGGDADASYGPVSISDSYQNTVEITLPEDTTAVEARVMYSLPSGELVTRSASLQIAQTFDSLAASTTMPRYNFPSPQFGAPGDVGVVVSLLDQGWTQASIDAGLVKVAANSRAFAASGAPELFPDGALVQISVTGRAFSYNPDGSITTYSAVDGEDTWVEFQNDYGGNNLDLIRTVPPGATHVEFLTSINYGLLAQVQYETNNLVLSGPNIVVADVCPPDSTGLQFLGDANPAHIIYECMTNDEWGLGESASAFDLTSFTDAAELFYNEKLGMSLAWHRQSEIKNFIREVLDHVKAFLFQHPATGLWTLLPLRDDYNAESAPLFDPSNCVAENRKRRAWGETVNEIVVSYTDPETENEATVSAHRLGNIQIQGGVISETRDYFGFRNPYIAKVIAERDVAEASYPLFSASLKCNRDAWQITPGDVIRFSWPEDGIDQMVCRVMAVKYGSTLKREIELEVVEDIFAVDQTVYSSPQTSEDPGDAPVTPLTAQAAVTAPAPILSRQGISYADLDAAEGSGGVLLFGAHDTLAVVDIEAQAPGTLPNGDDTTEVVATFSETPAGVLPGSLSVEVTSSLPEGLIDDLSEGNATPGDVFMIGTGEDPSEIVMIDALAGGSWSIVRGVWDTVPREWAAGTRIWKMAGGPSRTDSTERVDGEEVTYRLLPRVGDARLPSLSAAPLSITVSNRAHAPFRPANVALDGAGIGSDGVDYSQSDPPPTTVTASWANRNRTTEDAVILSWDDATVSPETDQTTELHIVASDGTLVEEITGLTGTSHDIPFSSLTAAGEGRVEFYAERDGELSIMAASVPFKAAAGYGYGYGLNYGGVS